MSLQPTVLFPVPCPHSALSWPAGQLGNLMIAAYSCKSASGWRKVPPAGHTGVIHACKVREHGSPKAFGVRRDRELCMLRILRIQIVSRCNSRQLCAPCPAPALRLGAPECACRSANRVALHEACYRDAQPPCGALQAILCCVACHQLVIWHRHRRPPRCTVITSHPA